jgi:hypothetical protein
MNKLQIDFENCLGIWEIDYEFDFTKVNRFLIYAPNGTMKTSFAKTFDLISKKMLKNQPCDRIYNLRVPKFEVLIDDVSINR